MHDYKYICEFHKSWVDDNPEDAFCKIQQLKLLAEKLLQQQKYQQANQFLGTAFETAEIIFDNRLESPQLTTTLTSLGIMLAHTYTTLGLEHSATQLLERLQCRMQRAIDCANGYATKVAFYRHCSSAVIAAKIDMDSSELDRSTSKNLH